MKPNRTVISRVETVVPGRGFLNLAAVILLVCVGVRPFLGELSFRTSTVKIVQSTDDEMVSSQGRPVDPGELLRVTFAGAILAAGILWLIGQARSGAITIRHGWLGWLIVAFAILSMFSVFGASNRRVAGTAWLEQASLLTAGFLAVQLFHRWRAFNLMLIVLTAVGITLAAKGFWQVFVEFPANAEYFKMYGDDVLRTASQTPGSPQAIMFEKRFVANTPYGYFSLANPFASMLIVMVFAAGSLAVRKLIAANAWRKSQRNSNGKKGEIHLPTLAAILTILAVATITVILALTRCRGAILPAVIAIPAAVGIIIFRRFLGRHWRKSLLITVAIFLLGVGGVIAYGLSRDSLPTKTMTFRWYYWTASSKILRENALFGVGPGNFPASYLHHRRVEGEEDIKMPHNVAVHALTQYGLPGGLCYLGILAYVLFGLARPAPPDAESCELRRKFPLATMAAVIATVTVVRWFYSSWNTGGAILLLDVLFPAVIMTIALAIAWWTGSNEAIPKKAAGAGRIVLACGLVAFVLHNMVTYSLWMPAPAMVFWVCAGACLARSGQVRQWKLVKLRWVAVAAAFVVLIAVVWMVCLPVVRRWSLSESMVLRLRSGDIPGAINYAARACQTDNLDAHASADAARLAINAANRGLPAAIRQACPFALQAIERDPANNSYQRLAGDILWHTSRPDDISQRQRALEHFKRAIELNPMSSRMRLDYAERLLITGQTKQCRQQLAQALYINNHLPPNSVMRFNTQEQTKIKTLQHQAKNTN